MTDTRDEARKRRDFFATAPRQAAHNLQQALPIDESSYQFTMGHGYGDARAYFLYGTLDEVMKACVSSRRWGAFLDEPEQAEQEQQTPGHEQQTPVSQVAVREKSDLEPHVDRVILESVIDEQQMWVRKLTELLADLILFRRTNDDDHYRLYLLCKQLDAYLGLQQDFQEFFACTNLNAESSITLLLQRFEAVLGKVETDTVWFINSQIQSGKRPRRGEVFTSARARFRKALESGSPAERIALGISYEMGYATPSRSIHVSIGGPWREVNVEQVDRRIGHVGVLCFHIVTLAYELAGIEPSGSGKQIVEAITDGEGATRLLTSMYQPISLLSKLGLRADEPPEVWWC